MEYIIHRVNSINELKKIKKSYGVEIDIRSNGSKLILNHEPFVKGESFNNYIDELFTTKILKASGFFEHHAKTIIVTLHEAQH